jgi:hypothetical protein
MLMKQVSKQQSTICLIHFLVFSSFPQELAAKDTSECQKFGLVAPDVKPRRGGADEAHHEAFELVHFQPRSGSADSSYSCRDYNGESTRCSPPEGTSPLAVLCRREQLLQGLLLKSRSRPGQIQHHSGDDEVAMDWALRGETILMAVPKLVYVHCAAAIRAWMMSRLLSLLLVVRKTKSPCL